MLDIIFDSELTPVYKFIMCCTFLLAIMIAMVCHEFAHAFIALKNGDDTAKLAGRVTFNPSKHFEITGVVLFLLVGIGWAKPVPINPYNFNNRRRGMFTVAIAGVVANLILSLIGFILFYFISIVFGIGFLFGGYLGETVLYFFVYMVTINLALFAFNILPIYPLDGFRVVEAFTSPNNKYRVFMYKYGSNILLGLFIADMVLSIYGYGPLTLYVQFIRDSILKLYYSVGGLFV